MSISGHSRMIPGNDVPSNPLSTKEISDVTGNVSPLRVVNWSDNLEKPHLVLDLFGTPEHGYLLRFSNP